MRPSNRFSGSDESPESARASHRRIDSTSCRELDESISSPLDSLARSIPPCPGASPGGSWVAWVSNSREPSRSEAESCREALAAMPGIERQAARAANREIGVRIVRFRPCVGLSGPSPRFVSHRAIVAPQTPPGAALPVPAMASPYALRSPRNFGGAFFYLCLVGKLCTNLLAVWIWIQDKAR